jgi:hypothetical protein
MSSERTEMSVRLGAKPRQVYPFERYNSAARVGYSKRNQLTVVARSAGTAATPQAIRELIRPIYSFTLYLNCPG